MNNPTSIVPSSSNGPFGDLPSYIQSGLVELHPGHTNQHISFPLPQPLVHRWAHDLSQTTRVSLMILIGTMGEKILSCWLDVNLRGWQSFNFCSSLVTMRNHICENRTNTGEVDSTDKEKNYALGFTPELNCNQSQYNSRLF